MSLIFLNLIGIPKSNISTHKEIEARKKQLDLQEQALNQYAQQLSQTSAQMDSALTGIIRNTLLQAYNWSIDEMLISQNNSWNTDGIMDRAMEHYNAIEAKVKEIGEAKMAEIRERVAQLNQPETPSENE